MLSVQLKNNDKNQMKLYFRVMVEQLEKIKNQNITKKNLRTKTEFILQVDDQNEILTMYVFIIVLCDFF